MKINIKELRYLICNVLNEKRRFHVEDRWKENYEKLKSYVDKGYFFHMTNEYLLHGLNPHTEHKTPFGIYAYPLTSKMFNLYIDGNKLPYAENRKFILIYSYSGTLLKSSTYLEKDFLNDAKNFGFSNNQILDARQNALFDVPLSMLMYLLYDGRFDKHHSVVANKRLRKMGYSGLYDDLGVGIIHQNEPIQAVFVGPDVLNIIDVFDNLFRLKSTQNMNKRLSSMSIEQLKIFFSKTVNIFLYGDMVELPEEVQKFIIRRNPEMFKWLSNPSKETINYMNSLK